MYKRLAATIVVTLGAMNAFAVGSTPGIPLYQRTEKPEWNPKQGVRGKNTSTLTAKFVDGGITCYTSEDGVYPNGSISCLGDLPKKEFDSLRPDLDRVDDGNVVCYVLQISARITTNSCVRISGFSD